MTIKEKLESYGVYDITPVEDRGNNLFLKRDDLYRPFSDIPLSGGKVRQAIALICMNEELIRDKYNGVVCTGCSMNSPQGVIVSRVAKDFGFESVIFVGNTNDVNVKWNPMMGRAAGESEARTDCTSKLAYENVLNSGIKRFKDVNGECFQVKFGINLETNPEAIIDSISYQVQNIPDDLDMLVVPVGSGITFGGILRGLIKYNKHPKRTIGIQISGYDRVKTIEKILGDEFYDYEFVISKDFPYSKHIDRRAGGVKLDRVYEAKAFDYMKKYIDTKDKKVCFWIVGDSSPIRKPLPPDYWYKIEKKREREKSKG